jgi:hypothetical protein
MAAESLRLVLGACTWVLSHGGEGSPDLGQRRLALRELRRAAAREVAMGAPLLLRKSEWSRKTPGRKNAGWGRRQGEERLLG